MRVALLMIGIACCAYSQTSNEEASARIPLENYLKGHATGDGSYMSKAFRPTAHIEGIRQGKFTSWTVPEYVAMFTGKPSPEEPQRKRWIDHVEVNGTAATARLVFDYPKSRIVDYMLLVKENGEWLIANKIYSSQLK